MGSLVDVCWIGTMQCLGPALTEAVPVEVELCYY